MSPCTDQDYMRLALSLARRGYGATSPNPMVGALVVGRGRILGRGWHHQAGEPHAEIEALRDAEARGGSAKDGTLYVTLEPCCSFGRTPPCSEAIIAAGIRRVVVGATDPNPKHCGRAFALLEAAGITTTRGVLQGSCEHLNEAFNQWIVQRTPFVTVKAAMTLDGKIATANGEAKWITGPAARRYGMRLRRGADAILVGINTVLADDPSLTVRGPKGEEPAPRQRLRRIVLDARARTPVGARVVSDPHASLTTIVVSERAPKRRVAALSQRARVIVAPATQRGGVPTIDLPWLLRTLGAEQVVSLLIEGGGEVNGSFLIQHLAHRLVFFYAPKLLGGRAARPGVGGAGAGHLDEVLSLNAVRWRRLGADWLLEAQIEAPPGSARAGWRGPKLEVKEP